MSDDLVVFGEDWGGHPSSTQHLIRCLQRDRRVVWVDSLGLRRPRLTARDLRRAWRKLRAMAAPVVAPTSCGAEMGGPTVVHPRVVPWPGNPLIRPLNRVLLRGRVREAMARAGVERPLLWTSLPTAVDLVGELGERASVYYCGDDFSALAGVDHRAVARLEAELVERVDLILAASPRLAERLPAGKTRLLPHGVDLARFGRGGERPDDLPRGRPIAGFYGAIAPWIDLERVAEAARRLPGWNFVLIGPVRRDLAPLAGLANVHLLGERPHRRLADYLHHWQVSLLPFADNDQIRACNPLKLREYLAAGRPVVSSDFPALAPYRDLVRIAGDGPSLAAAIERAAADLPATPFEPFAEVEQWGDVERLAGAAAIRRERVADEGWERRAAELDRWLAAL